LSFHDELQQRLGPVPSDVFPGAAAALFLCPAPDYSRYDCGEKVNRSLEPDPASTKSLSIEAKAHAFKGFCDAPQHSCLLLGGIEMSDKPDNSRPVVDKATQRASHEPRPQVSFVVEKENNKNHRYVCGQCGAPLFHRGTITVLDCIFLCPHCSAINEAPA
jgi:hypothetical protein